MSKIYRFTICLLFICLSTIVRAQQNFVYPNKDEALESTIADLDNYPNTSDAATAAAVQEPTLEPKNSELWSLRRLYL